MDERAKEVLKQIEAIRKQRAVVQKLEEKLTETAKGSTSREKRKYRKARWAVMRAQVGLSQLIREVEFTELVKRRLIEQIKDEVESVRKIEREAEGLDRQLNPKGKKPAKLKDEDRKNIQRRIKDLKAAVKVRTDELEQSTEHLRATLDTIYRGEVQAEQAKRSWSRRTCGWSYRLPRSTPIAACSFWI